MGRGGGEHRLVQQVVGQRASGGVDARRSVRVRGRDQRSVGRLPGRIRVRRVLQQRDIGLEHRLEQAGGNSAAGASQSMPRPPSSS